MKEWKAELGSGSEVVDDPISRIRWGTIKVVNMQAWDGLLTEQEGEAKDVPGSHQHDFGFNGVCPCGWTLYLEVLSAHASVYLKYGHHFNKLPVPEADTPHVIEQ